MNLHNFVKFFLPGSETNKSTYTKLKIREER